MTFQKLLETGKKVSDLSPKEHNSLLAQLAKLYKLPDDLNRKLQTGLDINQNADGVS